MSETCKPHGDHDHRHGGVPQGAQVMSLPHELRPKRQKRQKPQQSPVQSLRSLWSQLHREPDLRMAPVRFAHFAACLVELFE